MGVSEKQRHLLEKETEMRFELKIETSILSVKLVSGSAEIYGIELALNKDYNFREQNIAIFTWYGCVLESWTTSIAPEGSVETKFLDDAAYLADSTPMIAYINTHAQLEARRDVALANGNSGPRVIVVGPVDQGKSTLCQMLSAYAVRLDRNPIFVDIDIGQGSLSLPGCLSAIPLDKSCLSVEEGFINYSPLSFYYGHTDVQANPEYYKLLISSLAEKVIRRLEKDEDANASGIILNTCGYIEDVGYEILLHCINVFKIDVVLVIGQDKLFSSLQNSLDKKANPNLAIVKLAKSGGVVSRPKQYRRKSRKNKIREYFYGRSLSPSSFRLSPERRDNIPLHSLVFLKVGGGGMLSSGMKVLSDSTHQDPCFLSKVTPTLDLVNTISAVLHIPDHLIDSQASSVSRQGFQPTLDHEIAQKLISSNVAGFVSILSLDVENDQISLLCPCPGTLPSHYLLVGSVKFVE